MQCSSCGTTLQPGMTRCPSCGVPLSAEPPETADSSPYETATDAVPYIPYTPVAETPAGSPSPEAQAPQAAPSASSGSQAVGAAQPFSPFAPQQSANAVAQPQPSLAQPQPVSRPQQRRGFSATVTTLFVILALLIIGGGGGLVYYAAVAHPAELHAQATAVVQNILSEQAQANAQATANAASLTPQELYNRVTSSKPSLNDPLDNANNSIWLAAPGLPCNVTNAAYHASVSTKGRTGFCAAPATNFQDFAFQVQMTIIKGDMGGLTFRTDYRGGGSYFFGLDPFGHYYLLIPQRPPLQDGNSPAAKTGLNQPNLIAVIARSSKFYLYVNKQFVTSVTDSTYASGGVGLFAFDIQNPTEVAFSNAQVWTL